MVIDVGAGTYKGGITLPAMRGYAQDDFIKIVGPNINHPTVPAVVIDKAADAAQTYGIRAFDGAYLWLEDIKFVGAFENHADIRRNSYLIWRNVHMDGQDVGTNGLSIQQHCRYTVLGGIIENMLELGISEHFMVHRSFDSATASDQQLIIRNCGTGFQTKEACVGHLDYLNVEDCDTAIEFNGNCVTNVKGVTLKRNGLGIANVNSEMHNGQSVVFGTGADANTRTYQQIGVAGTDLTTLGWLDGSYARTTLAGHSPVITTAASFADATVTGTTTETNFYNFVGAIKPHRYTSPGRKFLVRANGKIGASALVGTYRLVLRVAGTLAVDVTIPAGTAANTRFAVEFEVVCSANGNNQRVFTTMYGGIGASNYATRTLVLDSVDSGIAVTAIPTNSADSVTLHRCEVYG
ncbi:hypothetical protein AB4Y77_01475 [Paenarthrobacter sp. YAF11_1]|uniref:hypothetical protein n=1 Tax=Paenarthrobacter sp. YAF11_1 TaxID=3233074 RepID=UPI003F98C3B3